METEQALLLSSNQFKAFYDPVSDPVFLYNPAEKNMVAANTALLSLLPADGLLPLPAIAFLPEEVLETLPDIKSLQTVLLLPGGNRQAATLEVRPVRADGTKLLLCIARLIVSGDDEQTALTIGRQDKMAALKEVYHRTKNNLNIIVSLIGLQLKGEQEERVRSLLQESKSRVYALALLQEHLYHSERAAEIKANEYLIALAQSIIASFRGANQHIKLVSETEACWLPTDTLVPLGLLVNELLSHTVLHAFDREQDGEVKLSLSCTSPQQWCLQIADNGKGVPEGRAFPNLNSLAEQLVKGLARQLKVKLNLSSGASGGTVVCVQKILEAEA